MLRERWTALFDPIQSPALYIIGTAALTVVITVLYDTVKERLGLLGAQGLAVGLAVLAVTVILYPVARRWRQRRVIVKQEQEPAQCKGLIVLVSPNPSAMEAVAIAVRYHQPVLKNLWLIATDDSRSVADSYVDLYGKGAGLAVYWDRSYVVPSDNTETVFHVTTRILQEEAPRFGLQPDDIVADITGGTKPMSVGVALACMQSERALQYVKSERTVTGDVDQSIVPHPIRIMSRLPSGEVS